MKATHNTKTIAPEKSPDDSRRKTRSTHSNVVVQGLTESRHEKDFITLIKARSASAHRGNTIEVDVDDL
jgi:hypothetical protein